MSTLFDHNFDTRVRQATFSWLEQAVAVHGDVLERSTLMDGFVFEGQRVHLVSPQQGIFKPRMLKIPLSILTAPPGGPYEDKFTSRHLHYRYRGKDVDHPDNRGLRDAKRFGIPLVYFHGLMKGRYLAVWPVFIVGDDPAGLTFHVAVDDAAVLATQVAVEDGRGLIGDDMMEGRRLYATTIVKRRIHQRAFRERVLEAYRRQCSFCRFRHEELLDAAHIIPDSEPEGDASVQNGLSLCRLHHAAFDRHFLGIRPDGIIQVRQDILEEEDGPTLKHAIQALHNQSLHRPRSVIFAPSQHRLEMRYERFLHQE
ncbi:MAG: HNH endonuclease [Candidatus Eisenbacteria bacterium]|nr:HNH endonuclease [Candidatus Eisenbacteria bacterium]